MIKKIPGAIYYMSTTDKTRGEYYFSLPANLNSTDAIRFVDIVKHRNTDNETHVDILKFNKFYFKNLHGEWILNTDISKNNIPYLDEVIIRLGLIKTGSKQDKIDRIKNYLEITVFEMPPQPPLVPPHLISTIPRLVGNGTNNVYVKKDGKWVLV